MNDVGRGLACAGLFFWKYVGRNSIKEYRLQTIFGLSIGHQVYLRELMRIKCTKAKMDYTLIPNKFLDFWIHKIPIEYSMVIISFIQGLNSEEIAEKFKINESRVLEIDEILEKMGIYQDLDIE